MESPMTSKATVSSMIGKGRAISPSPSGGTCSYSGSMTAPAPTRPMIGARLSSRYSMIGRISDALTRRSPPRISDTAPGRTPMASASPPLLLPDRFRPRSIIVTSSMVIPSLVKLSSTVIRNSEFIYYEYQNSNLTFASEYLNLCPASGEPHRPEGVDHKARQHGTEQLGVGALRRAARLFS